AAGDDQPPMLLAGKIDGHSVDLAGIRDRLAKDPQARHAPVREHRQTDVRETSGVGHPEQVMVVPAERRTRDYLLPLDAGLARLAPPRGAAEPARVDDALRGEVARKRGRVDVYRRDPTRDAKPNNGPVVSRPAPPTRFPSVDDLTARPIPSGLEAHRRWVQQ